MEEGGLPPPSSINKGEPSMGSPLFKNRTKSKNRHTSPSVKDFCLGGFFIAGEI